MANNSPRAERDPLARTPLRSSDFLVLLMLARSGDRHGYGIMQDVAEHTEGKLELEAGSLYRTIRRLQDEQLLEESSRRPAADLDDERRRYYRLTAFGKRVVAVEAARLRRLVRIAEAARILAPEPTR
jgi:DNA-binding PadR family transcriptional regulator